MSYHKAFFVGNHTNQSAAYVLQQNQSGGHSLSLPTSHQVTLGDGGVARVLANQAEIRNARNGALGPFTIRLLANSENLQNWEAQSPGPDSIGLKFVASGILGRRFSTLLSLKTE